MKQLTTALLFIIFVPLISFAGEISGTIKMRGQPVVDVEVKIEKGTTALGTAKTDKYGRYHINVKETGKLTLTVVYKKKQQPSFLINSKKTKVRYNFVLEIKKNKYVLKRVY